MTTRTKDHIRSILTGYREALARFSETQKELDETTAAARQLDEQISDIGEPDYRDAAGLDKIESPKRQKAACEARLKKLRSTMEGKQRAINDFSWEGYEAIKDVLREAQENLVNRISKKLSPFYTSRQRAREIAEQADAAFSARTYIQSLNQFVTWGRSGAGSAKDDATANQVEELMKEALKDSPDLERFFPFRQIKQN